MTINKALWTLRSDPTLGPYDVAAGVGEDVLNSFATAHHAHEHAKPANVYRGKGDLTDLRLSYEYDIPSPATFDLAPIPDGARSYRRWVISLPEVLGERGENNIHELVASTEANVKVHVPRVDIAITPTGGQPARLSYSMTVTAFVSLQDDELQVVPVDASVDDPDALSQAIAAAIGASGNPKGSSNDTCYELQELIKHVINVQLAQRIASFVQRIRLPTPLKLIDGVSLVSPGVAVRDNFVILTASVLATVRAIDEAIPTVSFSTLGEAQAHVAATSAGIEQQLQGGVAATAALGLTSKDEATAAAIPASGIFIYLTEKFFNVVLQKVLPLNESGGECGRWAIFEGCYNWFIRLWNPITRVVNSELHVNFDFAAGAGVKARVHTHCGPTGWVGVGIRLVADPARAVARLFFKNNREVMMSAGARPFEIRVETPGVPWPLSEIIGRLLSAIATAVAVIIAVAGVRLTRRLVNLPEKFPGTDLEYDPRLNQQVVNVNGDLAVLGTITFR